MKKIIFMFLAVGSMSMAANAQLGKFINTRNINAVAKTTEALTLTDEQIENYCKEYITWMDQHNKICDDSAPEMKEYADRLENIKSMCGSESSKFDIKVYYVVDQNAFACANGSIRVFAGLMDIMTDEQILGIIGHEMGHVVNKDTKDAFKKALLTSALKDAVASTGAAAAALTDSQLGSLGEALVNAQFSQKQEYQADDYGYDLIGRSGKDPKAMASALRAIQKMQDDAGAKQTKLNQLLSTHPDSGKRAERLEQR